MVLDGVIEADLIGALLETVDRVMVDADIPFGGNAFLGLRTRRIFNLLARDPLFARVPLHPAVLPLVEQVLDEQCLLSSLTAIEMHPGQDAQPLHCDDGSIALPRPHPPVVCVALWALTDFDHTNGATRLVPGSHRRDRRPAKGERAEHVEAEMPAGSVLLYNGSLWHGGGDNVSDERRVGIVVNHSAGFLRQEENQLLAVPGATWRRRSRVGCRRCSATACTAASWATSTSRTPACSSTPTSPPTWSGSACADGLPRRTPRSLPR